jgi:hypothetical protein
MDSASFYLDKIVLDFWGEGCYLWLEVTEVFVTE